MSTQFTYEDAVEMLMTQGHTRKEAEHVMTLFVAHVISGKEINARPTCEDCFTATHPHQQPVRVPAGIIKEEHCYRCNQPTNDGIYT